MRRRTIIQVTLLFIISIVLSGCSAEYNLVINANNKVSEKITISMPNELLKKESNNISKFLGDSIDAYKDIEIYSDYEYDTEVGNDNTEMLIYREYDDLSSYSESPFLNNLFDNLMLIENDEYKIFKTIGKYHYAYLFSDEDLEKLPENAFKEVTVNIQLQNEVLETNADDIDKNDNIYTWNFTPGETEKYIYIKYNHNKRYDVIAKSFFLNNIVLIVTVTSLVVILLVGTLIMRHKHMSNNEL